MDHREGLGDFERGVMHQQHSTGTDTNMLRLACDARDQNLRRHSRKRVRAVMLGNPITMKAQAIHVL